MLPVRLVRGESVERPPLEGGLQSGVREEARDEGFFSGCGGHVVMRLENDERRAVKRSSAKILKA